MAPLSDYIIQRKPAGIGGIVQYPTPPQSDDGPGAVPVGKEAGPRAPKAPRIRSAEAEKPVGRDAVEKPASALLATPTERTTARELLTKIGTEFAENRQKSKSKAFEIYQRAIATNLGVLVMGGAITLKEGTVLLMDLEAFVKSTQKEGETPATLLSQFLRGELEVE